SPFGTPQRIIPGPPIWQQRPERHGPIGGRTPESPPTGPIARPLLDESPGRCRGSLSPPLPPSRRVGLDPALRTRKRRDVCLCVRRIPPSRPFGDDPHESFLLLHRALPHFLDEDGDA